VEIITCILSKPSRRFILEPLLLYYFFLFYLIIIIISVMMFSYHRFSFPWHFSSWASGESPPLRLQVSACSTFLMMCDVPSMVVFFVEDLLNVVLVLFPDIFFKPLLTIHVVLMITGMAKHFMFHIRWISILDFYIVISYYHHHNHLHCCDPHHDTIRTLHFMVLLITPASMFGLQSIGRRTVKSARK
jgi:hypothetical protein